MGYSGLCTREKNPWLVGFRVRATRAFVLAGWFVGIYPTPVSIFAGAGSIHGSVMCTLQLRKSTYIFPNFLILLPKVSILAVLMFINIIVWLYITKKHTNINIHSSLLILIGSLYLKNRGNLRPVNRPDKASFSRVPVG